VAPVNALGSSLGWIGKNVQDRWGGWTGAGELAGLGEVHGGPRIWVRCGVMVYQRIGIYLWNYSLLLYRWWCEGIGVIGYGRGGRIMGIGEHADVQVEMIGCTGALEISCESKEIRCVRESL
jgi:hypothetical protein